MPTECNPVSMRFARLKGRDALADFGGGATTSDAGALLLGATGLVDRIPDCFSDGRAADRVVHDVAALAGKSTLNRLEPAPGRRRPPPTPCVGVTSKKSQLNEDRQRL